MTRCMDKNSVGWDEASGLQTRKSATVCRMLLHRATWEFQALTPVTPTSSTVGEVSLHRGEGLCPHGQSHHGQGYCSS